MTCNKKQEDYVYVKGKYQATLQQIYHYLRCEDKVDKNKVFSYCETSRYM